MTVLVANDAKDSIPPEDFFKSFHGDVISKLSRKKDIVPLWATANKMVGLEAVSFLEPLPMKIQ